MDVRWLLTRKPWAPSTPVFGITVFPPGAEHEIPSAPERGGVENLVSGTRSRGWATPS